MNCAEAGELLVEYLCDELAQEQRAAVEGHLGSCSACADEHARMRAASAWLDRVGPPLPEPLSPVPLLVRQATELKRLARRWRRGALAAAALAATVLLALAAIDHVRWEGDVLIVDFGGSAAPAAPAMAKVDARVNERLRRTESSINVLNESMSQLAEQQRRFIAEVQQAMEGTTVFAGTVPANDNWLAEFGLGPDDY